MHQTQNRVFCSRDPPGKSCHISKWKVGNRVSDELTHFCELGFPRFPTSVLVRRVKLDIRGAADCLFLLAPTRSGLPALRTPSEGSPPVVLRVLSLPLLLLTSSDAARLPKHN